MFDFIPEFFWKIIISLVGAVFQLVNYTYQVFLFLAQTNIFDQSIYHNLTDKIYVILGVVMLFVIAYNILTLIIDPDKNEKGATIEKILKNLVTSFILIIVCPSIFNFAFRVQNSILNTNDGIITNFFSDSLQDVGGDDTIKEGGVRMAVNTFKAFFTPTSGNYSLASRSANRSYNLPGGGTINCSSSCTLEEAEHAALRTGSFGPYGAFAMNIVKDEVEFNWLIALIAGGYLVYVIVSFCFDLAVRACKLAFYQIIAPIAISCRILPNQEEIFNKWFKAVIKTFLSVFIRVIIMNLGVFLVSVFIESEFFNVCENCSFGIKLIGYAFVILGIVTFVKQAPKLIDEIFGLGEDISLGIMNKLKDASVFQAGATIGSGATTMVTNATRAVTKFKDAKGFAAKAAALGKGVASSFAGASSGAIRGFRQGASAANFNDMMVAAGKGAAAATEARNAREARHDRYAAQKLNVITGHLADIRDDIKDWATGGAEAFNLTIDAGKKYKGLQDAIKTSADEVLKKLMNNSMVVYDSAKTKSTFKGSAEEIAAQIALYDELYRLNGNRKFSIATAEEYAKQLANQTFEAPKRSNYESDAAFQAAVENVNKLKLENSQKVAAANSMLTQLKKNAQNILIDNRNNAEMFSLKKEHMAELVSAVSNFTNAYNDAGGKVTDKITGKPNNSIDINNPEISQAINDVADAYVHNMQLANQDKQKYEDAAKARKGDNK